jgi:hypothetical protein
MIDRRVLWFVLVGAAVWAFVMTVETCQFDTDPRPGGMLTHLACRSSGTIASLELAETEATFHALLALRDPERDEIWNADVARTNTAMDFLLIALYWSGFVLLAERARGRTWVAVVAAITVAAVADIAENVRLWHALTAVLTHRPLAGLARAPSILKWESIAAAEALLAVAIPSGPLRSRPLAALLTIAALSTAIGPFYTALLPVATLTLLGILAVASYKVFPFDRLTLERVIALVEAAYLLRFQIAAALILAIAFPGLRFAAGSLFAGVFDAIAFWSVMFIVWAAFVVALTVMITSRLVLHYGPDRFPVLQPFRTSANDSVWITVMFGALAAPVTVMTWFGTSVEPVWKSIAVVAGAGLAVATVWLTKLMHVRIESGAERAADAVFPGVQSPTSTAAQSPADRTVPAAPDATHGLLRGIVRDTDGTLWNRVRSGHRLAARLLLVLVIAYAILGWLFAPSHLLETQRPAALFYLLLLLAVLTWTFAGLAFFLDALRLPVLTTALALSFASGLAGTDHQFAVTSGTTHRVVSGADAVAKWENAQGRDAPVVVVATAGGGIRAAAWTARVLTGLAGACDRFASSLLLVSSVSGGSVGSMYVVGSYDDSRRLPAERLASIRSSAENTSLSAVGWGLTYPDLVRTLPLVGFGLRLFSPAPQTIDRGWALEHEWVSHWIDRGTALPPTLGEWSDDVAAGKRPAVIFNATASESGQRFLMASTLVGRASGSAADAFTIQFADAFDRFDIAVPTAVRMSATFPWVSPMARPTGGTDTNRVHLGDGGYYDNSGVLSAVQWLLDARAALAHHPVTLVVIDAASDPPDTGRAWSWQRQIVAPLGTLLAVRTSSQQFRAAYERDVVAAYLEDERLDVTAVVLAYPADRLAPLSWHLTPDQRGRIERAWENPDANLRTAIDEVRGRVGCSP